MHTLGYLFVSLCICAVTATQIVYYPRYTADPAPLVVDGRVYIYTSHDLVGQTNWFMKDYVCMSSEDLVNWSDHGIVFSVTSTAWAKYAWAQQVVVRNGTYYMYFPDGATGGVGVANASSPTGPFQDVLGHPLVPGDDPTVYVDEEAGEAYICSNSGGPLCAPLNEDMISLAAPQRMLQGLPAWFEAPWLTKIGSVYYLSYMTQKSIGHYGYDIAYGVSSTPLGNYTFRGSLMWNPPFNCGSGAPSNCVSSGGDNNHQGLFEFPAGSGNWYFAYHNRKLAVQNGQYVGYQRNIALDRLYVAPDGNLSLVTSTPAWLRQIAYFNPYAWTTAGTMADMSFGLFTERSSEPPLYDVGNITKGAWVHVRGVDFGAPPGASTLTIRVASPLNGGTLAATLDAVNGTIAALCAVPNTGAWQTYQNVTCTVAGTWGIHDLYFVFNGLSSTGLFNFLSWQFAGGAPSGAVPPPVVISVALQAKTAGTYWSVNTSSSSGVISVSAATVGVTEMFNLIDNEDGTWSLQSVANTQYVCVDSNGVAPLAASSASPSACTALQMIGTTDSSYAFRVGNFVAAQTSQPFRLFANASDPRSAAEDSARFFIVELGI